MLEKKMNNFDQLDRRVASAFYGRFPTLQPAQKAAIAPILAGQNVVLSSGTGSGKTEAVMTPLISRYWHLTAETDSLTLLYIAPTKALVNDLEKRLYLPLYNLGLRVGVRHGDRDDLTSALHPHVLITTPESLEVLLFRKDANLKTVRAVVIDEVHLLYNTQRGFQLSILLKRFKQNLGRALQWAALSATIGRLSDVRDFLFGDSEDAVFLQHPSHRSIDAQVRHVTSESEFLNLIRILTEGHPVKLLIFANSRRECERLAGMLRREDRLRHAVFTHYSSLSPEVRSETEHNFSISNTAICIATSTLELGIDIGDIDAVILWGVPASLESFLQRIGRGNRRSDKTNVICLVTDDSENVMGDTLRFLALADAAKKGELPIRSPYELFGAVAQQCLSIIGSDGGRFTRIADLCKSFEHKPYLNRPIIETILAELADGGYLQHHGFKNQYGADQGLHRLVDYRMIYGNFGAGSQTVEVRHSSKILGKVPVINLLRLKRNDQVRFAGRFWRIRKISQEYVMLDPVQTRTNAVDFIYPSGSIGFDAFLTNRMWQLIHSHDFPFELVASHLHDSVSRIIKQLQRICRPDQIPYIREPEGIRYFTFAGHLVNKAVALITEQPKYKAEDISLLVTSSINWETIPTDPEIYEPVFHLLFEALWDQSVYQKLLPVELQLKEFIQDWLKDDTVNHTLARLANSEPIRADHISELITK